MRFSLVLGKLATNAHPPENAYFRGGAFPSTRTGFPSQTIPLRLFYHPISFWGAGGIFWTFSPFLLQLRFLAVFYIRVQPPTSFKSQSKDMVTDSMFQLAYKQGQFLFSVSSIFFELSVSILQLFVTVIVTQKTELCFFSSGCRLPLRQGPAEPDHAPWRPHDADPAPTLHRQQLPQRQEGEDILLLLLQTFNVVGSSATFSSNSSSAVSRAVRIQAQAGHPRPGGGQQEPHQDAEAALLRGTHQQIH